MSLKDPRLSDEVRWYLKSRNIPFPKTFPRFLTPEPLEYPGAVFDPEKVDRVLDVFGRLRHTQGVWAGRPLKPDPWEIAYVIAPIFGWVAPDEHSVVDEDGTIPPYVLLGGKSNLVRIIRKAHIEVPRKNGKTTLAGGIACYLTTADGEEGAQVFAVATGTRQAQYCFAPVRLIAQKSPDLSPYVIVTTEKIIHKGTGSYFSAVSSVAELLHGANVHGAIIDELHVHKNGDLVTAVETGMGARRQPLMLVITTADDSRTTTIYAQRRERIEQLARRAFKDPGTYGAIWAADPKTDDPFSPKTWAIANPGYPISPTKRYMEEAASEAQQSPAQLANFLRLHLNIRTKQDVRFLSLPHWDMGEIELDESELEGTTCYGGLDLASTTDLCALALDFPQEDGSHKALFRLWAPQAAIDVLDRRTSGAASFWVSQGWLTLTPGNVTDYKYIREQVNQDRKRFKVREIGFDPWNATELITDLQDDQAPMVEVRQGWLGMSAPTKEMQRQLLMGEGGKPMYLHGPNGAVRWQVENFAVEIDPQGNVKPSKIKAGDKIDAMVAAIIALSRYMVHAPSKKATYLGSA